MKLFRNYKFRLYPTKSQIDLLNLHFFLSNQAWNCTLALKMADLKENASLPKADRAYRKDKDIEKAMNTELKARGFNPHSGITQESFKSMKKSLQTFYSKKNDGVGFPKFKDSKKIEQSFYFKNQGISWTDEYFKILKNKISWKLHRNIPNSAKLNSVVVKRESDGKFYVILNLTLEEETQYPKSGVECAIDLNVKNIAISDTNGNRRLIKLEDFSKSKYSKTYIKLQQQLSKRYKNKNFSKNTQRLQKKSNRYFKKIKNKKEDFFHKLSNELTNQYDQISIENLEIKSMKESKSARLNRLISDISWNSLILKIKYKQAQKNKLIRELNPAYSSQRCNRCGKISKNNRKSQSDFSCSNCKYTTNADLNAADNLLDYDNWSLEQTTLISQWNQNLCIENVN
jgi:putative transposase